MVIVNGKKKGYSPSLRLSSLSQESLQVARVLERCSEMLFATQGAEVSTRSHRRDLTEFRLYCCSIRLIVSPASFLGSP